VELSKHKASTPSNPVAVVNMVTSGFDLNRLNLVLAMNLSMQLRAVLFQKNTSSLLKKVSAKRLKVVLLPDTQ
jgi:hypothetical protein